MKKLSLVVVSAAVIVLGIPVVQYRTFSPCTMLKQELVGRARAQAEALREEGRARAEEFGEDVGRLADEIGKVVEDAAATVTAGMAEARVDEMSTGQCVRELWNLKLGRES